MFVRWEDQSVDRQEQSHLPGYADPAAVRRFDAPEALDTRFHEVHAKSVLNRVPERSRMPFRWTVNPYRGCSHACSYCLVGETAILMGDGTTRPLADLEVGDEIYGTTSGGRDRRFIKTRVLDKWSSIKPAFEVRLADGTRLVASADHRFLSDRGWEHVVGAEVGPLRRPHLTPVSRLLGPGGHVTAPEKSPEYRRGYLAGMIRGDAHRFRLAPLDDEALSRSQRYLSSFAVATSRFVLAEAAGGHRGANTTRTQAREDVAQIMDIIVWPSTPRVAWLTGFLAGVFDAAGSCGGQALRIANTDPEMIGRISAAMRRLRFRHVVEGSNEIGSRHVRLLGGLPERMRFLLGTDPAITSKRSIEGVAVKTDADLRVVAVRPLGEVRRMYDITTGTEDFIANGAISHNCFARPTHTYLGFGAGRDFEREIVVKVNAPEVLRAELGRRSWKREHVALGTNTDPYQWVEGRYRLMVGIWEALRDAENPCSILTKSPLLLRDLKLMVEINERAGFTACLSIPTLDEKVWRETEPHTPSPRARLEAVAELNRAGIQTGVLIAPLMPGINDAPAQVEPLLERAAAAGASNIGGAALHLRGETREVFMEWLQSARPDLVPRYQELYRRAYAPRPERERLARLVKRGGAPGAFWRMKPVTSRPERRVEEAAQQTLF